MSRRDEALNPNYPNPNYTAFVLDKMLTVLARAKRPRVQSWLTVHDGLTVRFFRCNICGKTIEKGYSRSPVTKRAKQIVAEHREFHTLQLEEVTD
jgi:hypothetical protein